MLSEQMTSTKVAPRIRNFCLWWKERYGFEVGEFSTEHLAAAYGVSKVTMLDIVNDSLNTGCFVRIRKGNRGQKGAIQLLEGDWCDELYSKDYFNYVKLPDNIQYDENMSDLEKRFLKLLIHHKYLEYDCKWIGSILGVDKRHAYNVIETFNGTEWFDKVMLNTKEGKKKILVMRDLY